MLAEVDFTNVVSLGSVLVAALSIFGGFVLWRAAKNPATLDQYTKLAVAQGQRLDFLEEEVGRLTSENGLLRESNAGLTARVDELAKLNSVERILEANMELAKAHEKAADGRHATTMAALERIAGATKR